MSTSSTPAAGDGTGGTRETTTSEFGVREVSGSHVLTINGYSQTKRIPIHEFISFSFTAAGHPWSIRFFPNAAYSGNDVYVDDHVSIQLACAHDVKALFGISLLGETGELIHSNYNHQFNSMSETMGFQWFIKRKALERFYLKDDRLRIRCDITVLEVIQYDDATTRTKFVDVPPSDLLQHLGHLLASGDGADVTFEVDGETFSAHRNILAARSPVFKAELFSPMKEGTATCVRIADMEARVFKALLYFIYTDVFPEVDEEETIVMAQHLLVAADRYGLERLKLICEEKLCNYIDTSSAGTMLALAEQHGCHGLKKACSDFLLSGKNMKAAIMFGGFEHLMNSCPSVLQELLIKLTI